MNTATLTAPLDTAHDAGPHASSDTSSDTAFTAPLSAGSAARGETRSWGSLLRLLLLTSALSGVGGAMLAMAVLDRLSGDGPPPRAAAVTAAEPAVTGRREAGIPSADNEFFGREASTDEASGSY